MDAPDIADVLAAVNVFRAEKCLPPLDAMPCGVPTNPHSCPLAEALDVYAVVPAREDAGLNAYYLDSERDLQHRPLWRVFSDFATCFDVGDYPELVEPMVTAREFMDALEREKASV